MLTENCEILSTDATDDEEEKVLPELMQAISLCDNATMLNLQRTAPDERLNKGIKREVSPRSRRRMGMFSRRASTYRDLDMYETSQISFK